MSLFHVSARFSRCLKSSTRHAIATKRTVVTAARKEWLCILPDKPNVLELRKKVKQDHYNGIPALVQSGRMLAGGAMLDSHPEEGKEVPFRGSMIIYTGETVEEIRGLIKEDVYAKSGVWDIDNAQIIPYVSAVREPLVNG
ncbi:hypothetical protein ASPVEDRAFT_75640 [Aspergillus versicolor CBS 583.65]|uniref:YCII-related domain-containing protein n=1 Tax=Aspergillus versicolor CBS 583.65 TaxID=1036611 RepID=A0A1L9PYN6_ASPVE|nr:uncharacterized protein ASPVEDRAFT_75640 [Aspergillus versicolor CBS 583.65]OJJ06546.1 hypothetical protein ASPVEDRAFT_75640 [Aspergillus versicolor CBS 583.65]